MRFKVVGHPDAPLEKPSMLIEADGFTRDSLGITFFRNEAPEGATGVAAANQKREVAWFVKLAGVFAADAEAKEEHAKR